MTTAIRCGTLIDGNGGDPLRNATIMIDDGVITAIDGSGGVPSGADVIDASGMTVMPGMIDCHVHLMSNPPKTLEQRMATPFSLSVAEALGNARKTLDAGFTSVRDAGGTPRGVKLALEQGLFPGPRVRIAVGAIGQTGGHGDATMANGLRIRVPTQNCPTTSPTAPRARARRRARCFARAPTRSRS